MLFGLLRVVRGLHHRLVFGRRAETLARHLHELLPVETASLLDVGAGDGTIAALLAEQRPELVIEGVDVLIRPSTRIPVREYDGERLPYEDGAFDAVTLIDVLHHAADPGLLLAEAARVARVGVCLKDHYCDGPVARLLLTLMDWVGNRPQGVRLEYGYWSRQQWAERLAALGLEAVTTRTHLGLYPWWARPIFERRLHFLALLQPAAEHAARD